MMSPWLGLTHRLQPSGDLGDLADESDTVAESLAGGWGWVAGEFEDGHSALSFCSASSSRYGFAGLRLQPLFDRVPLHVQLGSEERNACLLVLSNSYHSGSSQPAVVGPGPDHGWHQAAGAWMGRIDQGVAFFRHDHRWHQRDQAALPQ